MTDFAISAYSIASAADLEACVPVEDLGETMRKIPRLKRRSAKSIHHIGNATNFVMTSPFGILHLSYSTKTGTLVKSGTEESQETSDETTTREEIRVFVTIHSSGILSAMGLNLGVQIALSKSSGGLDCRMRTYHAVPDDSLIFHLS